MDYSKHCYIFMLSFSLLFSPSVSTSTASPSGESTASRFEEWIALHGRRYKSPEEKELRFQIYTSNLQKIADFNAKPHSYNLTDNRFADMTNEEFRAHILCLADHPKQGGRSNQSASTNGVGEESIPKELDWRQRGAVTPVKDQGICGSCWAFSAVAAIEGVNFIKSGKLVSLSEQELVDCDVGGDDDGCDGGFMDAAFEFVVNNRGLASEAEYPYVGEQQECRSSLKSKPLVNITGYEKVPVMSERSLLEAVARQPVSVGVDGGQFGFQFYNGGIFDGDCPSRFADLNHGVAVVGFGYTLPEKTKFWIVKNSWGKDWGEEGYIRMKRDVDDSNGLCGITMAASYPTMSDAY